MRDQTKMSDKKQTKKDKNIKQKCKKKYQTKMSYKNIRPTCQTKITLIILSNIHTVTQGTYENNQ